VLLVAEVVSHLALEGALDDRLGELLEEAVVTEHVFGRLVILEQFVQEFWCNRHNQLSFRETVVDYRRLHNQPDTLPQGYRSGQWP
jgi:hypothetical protein